jgi:adenylylsulfate kinase
MASQLHNSRRTIAVDFDGVIADYDGYKGPGVLGAPRPDVIQALRALRAEGWKIVINSTRGAAEIAAYLKQHAIPHDEINRNSDYATQGSKPVADVYWDDRALRYSGDAARDLDLIRSFRTWSGRE